MTGGPPGTGPYGAAPYGQGPYPHSHPYPAAPQVYEPRRLGGGSHLPLVAPHLAPGEQVHAVLDIQLSDLLRRVPRRHRKERDGLFQALGVLFDLVGAVVDAVEEAIGGFFRNLRRIFRGRGLSGGWESQAGRFAVQVLTGGPGDRRYENRGVVLVFTDRRILLGSALSDGYHPYGEIPRQQLARVEPRMGSWSDRVEAYFADGSRVALDARDRHDAQALELLVRGQVPPPRPPD